MRVARLLFVSCASLIVAVPAYAQQSPAPTRSVDDYVCAFAGECGQQPDAAKNSIAAPPVRGFRLSVPEKRPEANSRSTQSPAGSSRSSGAATADTRRSGTRPISTRRTQQAQAQARPAASQARRMDLRVSFLLNSAELTAQAREEAKVFAEALRRPELAPKHFLIAGHTDSSGGRALNMELSKRRAQAVADYLSTLGISRDRLEVRGYGPDRPLPGHSASSPDNRRVEAELL
ncbi:OmpA family protein [Sphingomonas segetis]|jgi:outer membrane protein OmpA-like peptidoglycan-associated protein|uniref:OmpA family protein n=1 Tax=Sphingomonas segetis TaxID=1104779 RepID=UPI0012D346E5|nr:OmpA family protein [Sphingomonas segetis]